KTNMTLTKTKPKRPPVHNKKRTGQHHKRSRNYVKAYWPYLPILAVLLLGFFANSWLSAMHRTVLGYATDMSRQSLLDDTNTQRTTNGLKRLTINSQLNQAAQNKANDMAARDYWSHNTPDGKTPWTFITATGYSFMRAGENLAYGFATASDTITGWMNSPEHRANILNQYYTQVGFGYINIPDYQGDGPQTLVVAMYAQPATQAVAAASPKPVAPPTYHQSPSTPAPAPAPAPVSTTTTKKPPTKPKAATKQKPVSTPKSDTVVAKPADTGDTIDQQRVARIQLFTAGNAAWSMLAITMIACAALIMFLFNHARAWHRVLVRGERFVLHHPLFDVTAVSLAMLSFILSQTSGLIR
ncbi:MAG TPA: CAP domain-containing protein, partial [Candidatus Saccharimonadales bacterium]|nr:CAP domain-containing protein [Candidatus Saccharimonadales bacterium]